MGLKKIILGIALTFSASAYADLTRIELFINTDCTRPLSAAIVSGSSIEQDTKRCDGAGDLNGNQGQSYRIDGGSCIQVSGSIRGICKRLAGSLN